MRWLVVVLIMASGGIAKTPRADVAARAEALLRDPAFSGRDFQGEGYRAQVPALVGRVLKSDDPVARVIKAAGGEARVRDLRDQLDAGAAALVVAAPFSAMLNQVIESDTALWSPARFAGVTLSAETRALIAEKPTGERRKLLHRRLLEDCFGSAVSRYQPPRFTVVRRDWGRDLYCFVGNSRRASFDCETGRLASYQGSSPRLERPPIGLDAAEQVARRWLAANEVSLDGPHAFGRSVQGRDESPRYCLAWVRLGPAGEWLPSDVSVTVGHTGQVQAVFVQDIPVKIGLTPRVSREEAIRRALAAAGDPPPELKHCQLRVWLEPETAEQSLRWSVTASRNDPYHGEDVEVQIGVDALSGKVLQVSEPDLAPPPRARTAARNFAPLLALAGVVIAAAGTLALRRRRRV